MDDYDHSEVATNVYNYVKDHFKVAGMSGSIYDENKLILQLWIVILAISSAMIILIILSDSYLEPWLYLISIGIAVFINKGTNIMFDQVSSITNSIVAILQLALSMDYSIMLSNRYKQEKKKHANKIEAMKEALYHSFKSISSSSVTTIVGLAALVFMSFTIGKDLGLVLAKGVLLSLISIFFCLPALLLIFDHLIEKTKKKSLKFNLSKLGHFIYKTRYFQIVFVILIFIGSYFLKGNINILYTDSEQDEVGKIFQETNQIAIVYNNKYEELISSYCQKLMENEKIDQVLCYSNTLNEKLAYDELNKKFEDLGENTQIDEYLIKIIYYNYYHQNENKMTLNDFVSFIKSDIYTNENLNDFLDSKTKNNIDLLENFTSSSLINKKRTIHEIANILGMNEDDAKNLLIYYNSKNVETKMTISDFIRFMLDDVANDREYSSNLDLTTLSKLKQLQEFTNVNNINKKMDSSELSSIFGIDQNLVEQVFLLYRIYFESSTKMTLNEFSNYALEIASLDPYKEMFDDQTKQSLQLLKMLSDDTIINVQLDKNTLKQYLISFGLPMSDDTLARLYDYYTGSYSNSVLSLNDFATVALKMANQPIYKDYFADMIDSLNNIKTLTSFYNFSLPKEMLYQRFGIKDEIKTLIDPFIPNSLTPLEFVNTSLNTKEIVENLDDNSLSLLKKAFLILNNVDTLYNVQSLSDALSLDRNIVNVIYGFYDSQNGQLKNMSIKDFICFLYDHKENFLFSSSLAPYQSTLDFSYSIVNNTKNLYNYHELASLINVEASKVHQIFGLYDYYHSATVMTPFDFVNFLLENQKNELLSQNISQDSWNELSLVKEVMQSSIENIKYTSIKLGSLLNIDHDKISLLFSLYNSKYLKVNQEISLKKFVDFIISDVMNHKEYSKKFNEEKRNQLTTIEAIMNHSLDGTKYTSSEIFALLYILSDQLDSSLVDLIYMYYGSNYEYDESWKMTVEEFVHYLNSDIITDKRFDSFINEEKRATITHSKETLDQSKKLIVSDPYSRAILNTNYGLEDEDTYSFIYSLQNDIGKNDDIYIVGNSSMAVEMDQKFDDELNKITLLTMIFIFIVVAITFKDFIIPFVLVLIIQTAVYLTMSAISVTGGSVYFISLLIVQAILMGATIDYAILYTSYYRESRLTMNIRDNAYNKSIHTIISSSSILIIVTLVVAGFASAIAAKICETISQGMFVSVLLILFVLPGILAATDKFICRKGYYHEKK